nr:MAG TPA: hypothetical protein [Caudoviricetes sp.]
MKSSPKLSTTLTRPKDKKTGGTRRHHQSKTGIGTRQYPYSMPYIRSSLERINHD